VAPLPTRSRCLPTAFLFWARAPAEDLPPTGLEAPPPGPVGPTRRRIRAQSLPQHRGATCPWGSCGRCASLPTHGSSTRQRLSVRDGPELPELERVDLGLWLPGDGPSSSKLALGAERFSSRAAVAPAVRLVGLRSVASGLRLSMAGSPGRASAVVRGPFAPMQDSRFEARPLRLRVRHLSALPDPWWKKRHEKRLVLGELLVAQAARLLRDGGELFVQTDVEERAAQYEVLLSGSAALEPAGDCPQASGSPPTPTVQRATASAG